MIYFLWHGEHGDSGIFDLQKIIDEVGIEAGNVSCGKYGPAGAMHWFSEPLYGYYYANDAWVMRKHAELLTMANIDFLFFDVTNAFPYCGENMSGECGTTKQVNAVITTNATDEKTCGTGASNIHTARKFLKNSCWTASSQNSKSPGKWITSLLQ